MPKAGMKRAGLAGGLQRLRRWSLYENTTTKFAPKVRERRVGMVFDYELYHPSAARLSEKRLQISDRLNLSEKGI
jgi:hypothetical protein